MLFTIVLSVQTVYYLITALWGLIHIRSFMKVTGPKTDIWLVKTVSLLLLAASVCFIAELLVNTHHLPVALLAASCCIALAGIDFYYAGNKIILPVYFIDGIVQSILLLFWIVILLKQY